MIDRNRYKRYVRNTADGIIYYIKNIRRYKGDLARTVRYLQYMSHHLKDLIHYLNKF